MATSNMKTAASMYRLFGEGDLEAVLKLLHPDIVVTEAESLPYAGDYRGIDGYKQLIADISAAWNDLDISLIDIFGDETDETAIAHIRFRATSAKSGEEIDIEVMELITFEAGLLRTIKPYYFDTNLVRKLQEA